MADERFTKSLLRKIAREAEAQAKPAIPSRTLRRALRIEIETPTEGRLFIPHYWAVYVHDGRSAPFRARNATWLVFWRDPRQDPRLVGGQTPERASQLRRLTREEFNQARKTQQEAFARGQVSPVVIVREVKKPTAPTLFFDNQRGAMRGFTEKANDIGQLDFRQFALQKLRKTLGVRSFVPISGTGGVQIKPEKFEITIKL